MTTRSEGTLRARRDDLLQDEHVQGPAFGRALAALVDGWLTGLLPDEPGLGLVAVGGYGREELAPASDLDVLLLHTKQWRSRRGGSVDVGAVAEAIWYPIWDEGFRLDHSVRTVREALALADKDMKVALGLLDARCIAGDGELVATLAEGARRQWADRAGRHLPVLEESVRARHERFGSVAFALEPDLKEGRGGLRDVTVLRALSLALPAVELGDALRDAADLLFGVRVALQRVTGRRDDRLLLDFQDDVAGSLERTDADALMRDIAHAGRTVSWYVDDGWRAARAALEGPRRQTSGGRDTAVARGIVLRDGELALSADADPATDPTLLLRLADHAANDGRLLARPALRRLVAEAAVLPDPWPEGARDALVGFLGAGFDAIPAFETLDQHDLVTRILPEWAKVRSKPQRNAYHRFTVDRHLVDCAARAAGLTRHVQRPDLLLVGALLHDIGKGYPGDHTEVGIDLVGEIAPRMGFGPDDTAVLVDMVRHHLLLPSVATSRDLDDPDVIQGVAAAVGDVERLHLLAALTEADSIATGDSAWSDWKAGLVAKLTARVATVLGGESFEAPPEGPAELAADEALAARAAGGVLVEGDGRHVAVAGPDEPGLFSRVVGALALHGCAVRAATARSLPGGIAVSHHDLEPHASGGEPDWASIAAAVERARAGELAIGPSLEERAAGSRRLTRPTAAWVPEASVVVDEDGSRSATIVEVRAADSLGLLFRVTDAFAALGLDIRSARVATMGHEVVDAFYVVGPDGGRIPSADLEGLRTAVLAATDPNRM